MPPKPSTLDPKRVKNIQDTIYAVVFSGVAVAFMLFLLGSTSIMTSLAIIGMLLCLSLVGSVLRFLSMTRTDRDLRDQQISTDRDMRTLQARVNDHDLTLLQINGQIEGITRDIAEIRTEQAKQAERHRVFMTGMKDRMLQLVSVLTQKRNATKKQTAAAPTAPARAKGKAAPIRMIPAMTANDTPVPAKRAEVTAAESDPSVYDEDVVVSPSLVRDALDQAIKAQRVDIYMQPIATLPQRRVYAYEVYGRVRLSPGVYIPAREYRGIAAHNGALIQLDRMVLAEIGKQKAPPVPLLVNITRDALSDRSTVMSVVKMIRANPELAHKLVLEITHKDFQRISESEEQIMRELQRVGVEFGINDVQGPDIDLNRMAALSFRYLKLSKDRLLTSPTGMESAPVIQRFLTRLQARNIQLIVSQIETDRTVRQLLDYPVSLGQGYVFGRPDRPVAYTNKSQVA